MSVSTKRPPFPVILIANNLLDGEVVFHGANGWVRNPMDASIARDDAHADAMEAAGKASAAAQEVVDVYLVDVTINEGGLPIPNHFRERFRIFGPTIRKDLGKQAEYSALRKI